MQLDADLGIDSIKRVEILAALQERLPDAPVIGPEHLGTLRTLGQIAEFLAGLACPGRPSRRPTSRPAGPTPGRDRRRRAAPAADPVDRRRSTADRRDRPPPTGGEVWVVDDGSDLAAARSSTARERWASRAG